MDMKSIFLAVVAAGALAYGKGRPVAEEAFEAHVPLDINGAFERPGSGGCPQDWLLHTWAGYKPFATVSQDEGPDGRKAIHIGNVTSRHGTCFRCSRKFPCRAGDTVKISFLAKGRGTARAGCYLYTAAKGWNGGTAEDTFTLSDEWRLFEYDCKIKDKPAGETAFCEVVLGGGTGLEASFADVRAALVKGGVVEQRQLKRIVTTLKTIRHDDYEKPRARPGSPEIVKGHIAPGLMSETALGVYRTSDRTVIEPAAMTFALPPGEDEVFSASYRLYGFGRPGRRTAGRLVETFAVGGRSLTVTVSSSVDFEMLDISFACGGSSLGSLRLPLAALPADLRVDASPQGVAFAATSLSDSSVRRFAAATPFFADAGGGFTVALALEAAGSGAAEVVLDERRLSVGRVATASGRVPCRIDPLPEFDPVKAGWPLIFEDEFEGSELNTNKWYFPHYGGKHRECFSLDGKGHLNLKVDWDEKNPGKLKTDGIWSKTASAYGYFVARLKFTKSPGWWAAFWLYGVQDDNPFLDGFEIDIFEDYYTRAKPGQESPRIIDHNNHVRMGSLTKSWNYNSVLPGDVYDWYELGCKWTPFEISYYLNGRLIASKAAHSDHRSVTFDAIQHFAGITPLHAIISGQKMRNPSIPIDPKQIPETFEVDWVRIYSYPDAPGESPSIAWSAATLNDDVMRPAGSRLRFGVSSEPGAKTKSPVETVYLFDNGYLIDYRTKPPYAFEIPFTDSFYQTTRYMKPGRSGQKPVFDAYPHVFVAYSQDAAGRVSHTDPIIRIPVALKSAPYEGKAQTIPGTVSAVRFDEGGLGVSCYTSKKKNTHWDPIRREDGVTASKKGFVGTIYAGDWLNYTVDVKEAGRYRVKAFLQIGIRGNVAATLLLDGRKIGRIAFDGCTYWRQGTYDAGSALVELPAGRHVLTFMAEGGINFRDLQFEKD